MKKSILFLTTLFLILQVAAQGNFRIDRFEAWRPEYIKKTSGTPSSKSKDQSWQEWCEARIRRGDLGNNTNEVVRPTVAEPALDAGALPDVIA